MRAVWYTAKVEFYTFDDNSTFFSGFGGLWNTLVTLIGLTGTPEGCSIQMETGMAQETEQKTGPIMERETNRALLIFYDSITLLLVWFVILVLHPSVPVGFSGQRLAWNLALGVVCFIGSGLLYKVYRQILRFGSMRAFSRQMAACLTGSAVFLMVSRFVSFISVRFTSALAFCVTYTVLSLLIRVLYYYLYHFAKRDTPYGRTLKKILTRLTLVDFDSKQEGGLLRVVLEPAAGSASPINEIQNVAEQFAIRGDVRKITPIKKGYINRTYRVETLSDAGHVHTYTLQRINTNVFRDVDALMENYKLTTDHLYGKFLLPGHTRKGSVAKLRVTKDGRAYLRTDSGCWRMLTYFDNVYSLDIPDSPETFYYAGRAFGKFVKEMADLELGEIRIVIPNFHNTRSRYEDLEQAIAADAKGRVRSVTKEIDFIRQRADRFGLITDALESGEIPYRICHNDCNLNNILFDKDTHLPVAVIDLDTVMPSSPLYDFGDSMRIGTNTARDDEKDLKKVSCDLFLYERYARGYLEECGKMLTAQELALLPYASLIITAEDGIRFLMDHIQGDTYYNIYYPGQNLDRSRTQLALLADMEKKLPEIVLILKRIYKDLKLDADLDEAEIVKAWSGKAAARA